MTSALIVVAAADRWSLNNGTSIPPTNGPRRHIMMSIMCAETTTTLLRTGCSGRTRTRGGLAAHIPRMRDAG
jgi:hypothetical protein